MAKKVKKLTRIRKKRTKETKGTKETEEMEKTEEVEEMELGKNESGIIKNKAKEILFKILTGLIKAFFLGNSDWF